MYRGYFRVWRKIEDNPLFHKPAYLAVFIWLLREAEHGMKKEGGKWHKKKDDEMKAIMFNGKKIRLKPGQFTMGAKQLSSLSGVPRGTVERILKCFKNEEMIEVQTSNRFSLITVKNWEQYQMNEEQNEERMRSKRGASEEPVRTPKECNHVEHVENEKVKTNVDETSTTVAGGIDYNRVIDVYTNFSGRRVIAREQWKPKIKKAFATFTEDQIRAAWANMATNKFLRGENEGKVDYFTIEFALNIKKIEKYATQ